MKGLPPTLIQVGAAETLLADATRFAAAAGAADVRVTLEIWPHDSRLAPVERSIWNPAAGLANAGTFIRERL